jgi:Carboxypeptidase regulatory-like domain
VGTVEGTSVIQVGTQEQPGIRGACFVLFTEKEHKLVASVKSDSAGRFELKDVAPGRYRLIARAEGFCTANIPLEVVKSSRRQKTEILVHFRPAGIDTCSYGELAPKHTPTTQ